MTSMLLTDKSGREASPAARTMLLLFGAVAHRVVKLLALLDSRRLQLRANDLAHGLDPVADNVPLLAGPLLDQGHAVALVVLAGHAERAQEALHAELFQPLLREVEVLVAPAHLLAGERLVPVLRHRGADALHVEHGVDERPVVEHLADLGPVVAVGSLPLVVHVLEDVLVNFEAG